MVEAMVSLDSKRTLHFCFLTLYCGPIRIVGVESARPLLVKAGFRASQIFFGKHYIRNNLIIPKEEEMKLLINKLSTLNPDIIIMNVAPLAFWITRDITKAIKAELNIPILWGGLQPTVSPEECIKIADMICVDEGEEAILELAQKISKGEDITYIQNIWIRKGSEIIKNHSRKLSEDLNWIPQADYRKGEIYYINSDDIKNENENTDIYFLMTSRGCPFDCSFCCCHIYQHYHKRKIRFRTVENIINNLCEAKKIFCIKEINFTDDIFAINTEWTTNFCKEYKQKIALPFFCYLHPLLINEDKLNLLIEAGLKNVDMGIQSGSFRVRKEIFERYESDEDILKAAGLFARHKNLLVIYDIIVDNPFEKEQDKQATLHLLLNLPGCFKLYLYPLYFFPGTKLTQRSLKEGLISQFDIAGQRPGKIIRELKDDWRDYRGGKRELSWVMLLRCFNIDYYGFRLYPNWVLRIIGGLSFIKRYPKLLRFLLLLIGIVNKVFIYTKKFGLKRFLIRIKNYRFWYEKIWSLN